MRFRHATGSPRFRVEYLEAGHCRRPGRIRLVLDNAELPDGLARNLAGGSEFHVRPPVRPPFHSDGCNAEVVCVCAKPSGAEATPSKSHPVVARLASIGVD